MLNFVWVVEVVRGYRGQRLSYSTAPAQGTAAPSRPKQATQQQHLGMDGGRISGSNG